MVTHCTCPRRDVGRTGGMSDFLFTLPLDLSSSALRWSQLCNTERLHLNRGDGLPGNNYAFSVGFVDYLAQTPADDLGYVLGAMHGAAVGWIIWLSGVDLFALFPPSPPSLSFFLFAVVFILFLFAFSFSYFSRILVPYKEGCGPRRISPRRLQCIDHGFCPSSLGS